MPDLSQGRTTRPRAGRRSRATLAEELQAEFEGARVFQLFALRAEEQGTHEP